MLQDIHVRMSINNEAKKDTSKGAFKLLRTSIEASQAALARNSINAANDNSIFK